jgi:energy-coupling factor transporter ATP-binding protein EcfA2
MKLISFNIQNYRSIIHSGWCSLAFDNITALIGQNESGKTSVLEALNSFFTGVINEDILRSDLSFPIVHCRFLLESGNTSEYLENSRVPDQLKEIINLKNEFTITRKWNEDRESIVFISDEEILRYYESEEIIKTNLRTKTQEKIDELLSRSENFSKELENAEYDKIESQKKLTEKRKILDEYRKLLNRAKKPDAKLIAQKELELIENEYKLAEEEFKLIIETFDLTKQKNLQLSDQVAVCKICNSLNYQSFNLSTELEVLKNQYKEFEHRFEISSGEKEQKAAFNKLELLKTDLNSIEKKYQAIRQESVIQMTIAVKVLGGQKYRQAEIEARQEIDHEKFLYNIYEIGEILFKYIPVFEFFEDFSSLLPNKIDLEDILNENAHTEGYKAARNFLQIAGLNADFFREKNHRILKQKIENLNGEITIDFQDYWSQNVGKNNKIKLNFELEHYDFTHPEKSGKPYLEFWIKDKQERLYPKQRSRGVRWFLSFYLELKATAKKNHVSRILLIDEPGLSLHARAQEDVMKVFEDLKDKMQIIYCTHSPHLIDVNKLHRILAVQRADQDDDRSETLILDPCSLYSASPDTLSPVYSLMGVKINNQNFISQNNNIIVEDSIAYYYFNALCKLSDTAKEVSFIPSTGITNIPVLSNILMGWKIGFHVLIMGESRGSGIIEELNKSLFFPSDKEKSKKIVVLKEFEYPEDIFSTLDFKKFVLQKREGITDKNSVFITDNDLSRAVLASQFLDYCKTKKLSITDFDDETKINIKLLMDKIKGIIT